MKKQKPKRATARVSMPQVLYVALQNYSMEKMMSVSTVIRLAINSYIGK
jgi:hypothetical protein